MENENKIADEIVVTNEEIQSFEPLIHKIIRKHVTPYWQRGGGFGKKANDMEQMDTQLGMCMDDLVQLGRLWTFQQIKWYKQYGMPEKAQLFTMIYRHLVNKFLSLSISATRQKRGGMAMNNKNIQQSLHTFVSQFNYDVSVEENKEIFRQCLSDYFKVPLRIHSSLKTKLNNKQLIHYVQKLIFKDSTMNLIYHHDLDDFTSADACGLSPEANVILQETIQKRIKQICQQYGIKKTLTLNDYMQLSNENKFTKRKRKFK